MDSVEPAMSSERSGCLTGDSAENAGMRSMAVKILKIVILTKSYGLSYLYRIVL